MFSSKQTSSVPVNSEKENCEKSLQKVVSPEGYIKHPLQNRQVLLSCLYCQISLNTILKSFLLSCQGVHFNPQLCEVYDRGIKVCLPIAVIYDRSFEHDWFQPSIQHESCTDKDLCSRFMQPCFSEGLLVFPGGLSGSSKMTKAKRGRPTSGSSPSSTPLKTSGRE